MNTKSFKSFLEDIGYTRKPKEVIATVTGKESEKFTKIAKKLLQIELAEQKIKELKDQVKAHAREDIASLFEEAEDALKTRRVETQSVVLVLSKQPEPSKVVQYKEVVEEMMKLFSEYEEKIQETIEKFTRFVQKEPSLRIGDIKNPDVFKDLQEKVLDSKEFLEEGLVDRVKMYVMKLKKFLSNFDSKLAAIKKKIAKYRLDE